MVSVEMMEDILAVICTRSASRRLPGKANKLIAGIPVLQHIVNRLNLCDIPVVFAVPSDDSFIQLPPTITSYHGENSSPLHRMARVAELYKDVTYFIRITHDDILIDGKTVLDLVSACKSADAGYGYTPGIIEGAGVEVIHRDNLIEAAKRRKEPTEFISYFVKGQGMPKEGIVALSPRTSIKRQYRLTIDYPQDALVVDAVLRTVGPNASLDQVAEYVDSNQHLLKINRLPELSIYTCAHNAEDYIGSNFLSVSSLKGVSCEHIVVDDCSTDETLTRASVFYDNQKILVNEKNLGLASSSNKALDECRGKYVMRLDADDYLSPDQFNESWPFIKNKLKEGAQVVYCGYIELNGRKDVLDPREFHHAGGAVFDKAFLNELRFKENLRHWDGAELYQRMVKLGAKIAYVEDPVWVYRKHKDSMSSTNLVERQKVLSEIIK